MIDWESIGDEAARILGDYLRIPSVNPPGDERGTAEFLAALLRGRDIESSLHESGANRVNLTARLPGNGKKRPVLLYNHMDVVEAAQDRWTCEAFGGQLRDGHVWGRGAIDMKGMAVMQALAMDLLRRHRVDRSRDIIFFAAADEEKGGEFGARWMIEHRWPEIDAEFVWDEGGFGLRGFFGPATVFSVAIAEKQALWVRLVARGKPGHSGMPRGENAAVILLRALDRILARRARPRLHPAAAAMFAGIGRTMPFPASILLERIGNPLVFRLARHSMAADPAIGAMLRDTVSVTSLRAGGKENIIPERAEATLDIRLLPDSDHMAFIAGLGKIMDDDRVGIEIIQAPEKSRTSDADSEFYRCLSDVLGRLVPESVTVPMLTPGTTDSCFFRAKGVDCYGLFPSILDPGELARFHGDDERISVENLRLGTRVIYEVLLELTR